MAKREIKNPATGLFNTADQQPASLAPKEIPSKNQINDSPEHPIQNPLVIAPEQKEARSQRKQILLAPSIHNRAEIKCKELGISMNEAINQLLQNWIENN